MRIPRIVFFPQIALALAVAVSSSSATAPAYGQSGSTGGSANAGQGNTATSRTNNPDGSTTITTTTTYKDGSVTTESTYDKDGHDAGTVRTDVQTKDGETTTTITRYDGNGHEIGKTITRVDKDGNSTITNYDGNGRQTDTTTLPPFKYKPDWKIGLDYKVPPEWRYLPKPKPETQNSANTTPPRAGTTRVTNADGTTITTVSIFSDGWTITVTRYDRDGHDAGTTRTDVQTKNGQTTTTTTNWDGNGHETGKTVERGEQDGSKTITTYDGSGHETGRKSVPKTPTGQGEAERAGSSGGSSFDRLPEATKESLKLALARRDARLRRSQEQGQSTAPQNQKLTPTNVSLVLPAQASATISGTVLTEKDHPERFKGVPGLQVLDLGMINLPSGSDGNPSLHGLVVDAGNHILQPADESITLKVPASDIVMGSNGTIEIPGQQITLLPSGNPAAKLSRVVTFQGVVSPALSDAATAAPAQGVSAAPDASHSNLWYQSPVCLPGVAAVHGPLSGDIRQMVIDWGDRTVFPVAANEQVALYPIPDDAASGPTQVTFVDGSNAATFQTMLLKLITGVDQPVLHKGGKTNGHVSLQANPVNGPPQQKWEPANFKLPLDPPSGHSTVPKIERLVLQSKTQPGFDPALVNMTEIQTLFPGFRPPQDGQSTILVGIQSLTNTISIKGGPIQFFNVTELPWQKTLEIQATADGGFNIHVIAQAFSPPVAGQNVTLPPELRGPRPPP